MCIYDALTFFSLKQQSVFIAIIRHTISNYDAILVKKSFTCKLKYFFSDVLPHLAMATNMQTLYNDLMALCYDNDSFYYKDICLQSINYRIFNYRLCSYVEFQSYLAALNCRGTMFNITDPTDIQLVCLPPEKFFNYNEGFGQSREHEKGKFGDKMEKMDGSLISTFLHRTHSNVETLQLKSKLSLTSQQAQEAMQLLEGMRHLIV